MNLKRILLATDFSDCSRAAFAPAADLARRLRLGVTLIHASTFPPFTGAELIGLDWEEHRKRLRAWLVELARDPSFQGLEVKAELLEGSGVEALRKFQGGRAGDLLVLATHGYSGLKHVLLGSFTERAVRLMPCPVLAVRAGPTPAGFTPRRILFPYDLSKNSEAALDAVRYFARTHDAEILMLHVLAREALPVSVMPMGATLGQELLLYWQEADKAVRSRLAEFAGSELSGLKVQCEVTVGRPAAEIVERAKKSEADLIIMGTQGRTGLSHVLLGSVAEEVVRKAPCSTLTVHGQEATA